jgi:hypothetical protein
MKKRSIFGLVLALILIIVLITVLTIRHNAVPTLHVVFKNRAVMPARLSVNAGKVKIEVKNADSFVHSPTVFRAASLSSLPTEPNGAVAEDDVNVADHMGAFGDMDANSSVTRTFHLTKGDYVLFCTTVSYDSVNHLHVHYADGEKMLITAK